MRLMKIVVGIGLVVPALYLIIGVGVILWAYDWEARHPDKDPPWLVRRITATN